MNELEKLYSRNYMDEIRAYEERIGDCNNWEYQAYVNTEALLSDIDDEILEIMFDDCSNLINEDYENYKAIKQLSKLKKQYVEDVIIELIWDYNIERNDEVVYFKFNSKSPIHNLLVNEMSRGRGILDLPELINQMIQTYVNRIESKLGEQDDYSKIVTFERCYSEDDVTEEIKQDGIKEEKINKDLYDYFEWIEGECTENYLNCLNSVVNEAFREVFC